MGIFKTQREPGMNLWIDARMIACGGIGTVLKNLIPPLASSFRVTVLAASKDQEQIPRQTLRRQCDAPIYSIQEQLALPKIIEPCDLFWSPHYNIPVLPIRAKKRIVTIHDAYHLAFQKLLPWKQKLYAKWMFSQAARRSDRIITDSQFSREELCRFLSLPQEAISVIPPGVDVAKFSQPLSPEIEASLRKKYTLPQKFFLFVGNIKPHKNLKLILETMALKGSEIPFVIIGKKEGLLTSDPLMAAIENNPLLQQKIRWVGAVSDTELAAFYKMALCLVFPSFYEGFGLPPLEAMAAGCPTLVSHRASLPEVCGDASYFLYSDKPEELQEALEKMSSDSTLRQTLLEKGRLRSQLFSWERSEKLYYEIFKEEGCA